MKIIEPKVELVNAPDYETLLSTVEQAGRTCYKSGALSSEVTKLSLSMALLPFASSATGA